MKYRIFSDSLNFYCKLFIPFISSTNLTFSYYSGLKLPQKSPQRIPLLSHIIPLKKVFFKKKFMSLLSIPNKFSSPSRFYCNLFNEISIFLKMLFRCCLSIIIRFFVSMSRLRSIYVVSAWSIFIFIFIFIRINRMISWKQTHLFFAYFFCPINFGW